MLTEGDEAYTFDWVGKKASIVEANKPIHKTLRPVLQDSKNWNTTENLYIEGDNLDALKLLQESYLGKIKLIYIDPPYNRGSDLIYKDHFPLSQDKIDIGMGLFSKEGNRVFINDLTENNSTNPKFHSDWCSMIYSRLLLSRNLLKDEGVVFISINDAEADSLRKICNEVYGEHNYIATLIWDKNHSAQAGIYKTYHEYILVYAKNIHCIGTPKSIDSGLFEAGAMKKESGRHSMKEFRFPAGTRFDAPEGKHFSGSWGGVEKVTLIEGDMYAANGKLAEPVTLEAAYTQYDQMKQYFYGDKENLVDSRGQKITEFYLSATGKVRVVKKRGVEAPSTICHFGAQGPASNALAELFGTEDSPFDAPKPVAMLKDFIYRFTDDNDIVCDFFAGSSTTAHAVMELNAEHLTHKKFILVQLPEDLKKSLAMASKDGKKTLETAIHYLDKHNKPYLLTEIGKERIRLAAMKIQKDYPESLNKVDFGFRDFVVDSSNMKNVYYAADAYNQGMLDGLESNIKGDRTDLDLLFGCLVDWGLPLSKRYRSEEIDGVTVHDYDNGALVACFAENVPETVIKAIARKQPLRVVFRDSCFQDSAAKINLAEIFKMLSPDTTIKVL